MAALNCGFELGANGATITTGNQGDGDAWDQATAGTAATLAYDSTHAALGAQSCKIATAGTSTTSILRWITKFGTQTDHYGRCYMWFDGNPAATLVFLRLLSTAATAASLNLLSTGKIRLTDQAGTARGDSTNTIATGQWIRLEWHVTHSTTAGLIEVKLFNTATSGTATETLTSTGSFSTLASADRILFGINTNTANVTAFWFDQIQAAAAGYPGVAPAGVACERTLLGVG